MSITEDDLKKLTFIQLVRKLSIGAWCWVFAIIGTLCFASYQIGNFIGSYHDSNTINFVDNRHTETTVIIEDNGSAYINLKKAPISDSVQIFWHNLYIQPEAYKIENNRIVFDTQKESGLVKGQKVTAIYYDKEAIDKLLK